MLQELDKKEIEETLHRNFLGRIGCRSGDKLSILPLYYHYKDGLIYCRSYEGDKVEAMRSNPIVCFEVEEIHSMNLWKTVLCRGLYEELRRPEEIAEVQKHLAETMLARKAGLSEGAPDSIAPSHKMTSSKVIYYYIRITEWTGRSEAEIVEHIM